jgi:hypothetical protein
MAQVVGHLLSKYWALSSNSNTDNSNNNKKCKMKMGSWKIPVTFK